MDWMLFSQGTCNKLRDGWVVQMDGRTDGWMDRQTDGWID